MTFTNLGENIVLSASGRAAGDSMLGQGMLLQCCVLLTASHSKHSRGAEGTVMSFSGKVPARKAHEVFKARV